jgi:TonB family protein
MNRNYPTVGGLLILAVLAGGGAAQKPGAAPEPQKTAPAASAFGGPGVARPGDRGLTPPQVEKEVRPGYTAAAMKAKIEGGVTLECIVKADGTVGDVRVVKSLDTAHGLDEEAIKAARQWRFKAGLKQGKPVPVLVTLDFSFHLRDDAAVKK